MEKSENGRNKNPVIVLSDLSLITNSATANYQIKALIEVLKTTIQDCGIMTFSDQRSADELATRVQELAAELEKANQVLRTEILEHEKEKHRTHRYDSILEGINRIFGRIVKSETEEELGIACLSVAMEITGSQIGFVGEVDADGLMRDIAISGIRWNQRTMYDKTGHRLHLENFVLRGLYDPIIDSGRSFFTNNPPAHTDGAGLAHGHTLLISSLGVPLISDGKIVGVLVVANRDGGYNCEQQEDLEALAPAVVQVLQRKRKEKERERAEKALQASEIRYRSLYENSLDGILLTRPDGTILSANPQACRMFGMTEAEIIRAGREGIVVKDEKLAAALEERELTGRMRAELTYRRKDGSTFVGEVTSHLFVDADNDIMTSMIVRDVTGRKWAEDTLRQSERSIRVKLEKILSPALEVANLELGEIVDIQAIKSLMDDFYKLTYIPIGLNDLRGNVLAGVGWQDICTRFHRVHPETCKHCIESDTKLSTGVVPGEFKLYKCKNNMWDITTPIMVGDQQVGIIFLGQFFFEDEPLDHEFFLSQARKYGFTEEEYITALEKVPRLSREAVNAGMSFLAKLANMISQLSYSNIKLAQSLAERDTLVDTLREGEERFRSVLENSLDAAYRRNLQTDSYDYISPVIEQLTGFSAREMSTMGIIEALDHIHPDDRSRVASELTRTLDTGFGTLDYRFKRKDGQYRWLADQVKVIKDQSGRPLFIGGVFRDVTERKQAEEALRLSSLYNRSLIEASLDPLVTIGPDGKITDVNGATEEVTGYCRNDLIGTDFSDYFTEPEKAHEGYQQVFTEGEARDYPLEIQHKDGHITPVLYNASVYKDENGKVIGVFAAARDITERKRVEEALKKVHDNLEKLVEERTEQLEKAYTSLKESEEGLAEAQKMAHIGNWNWNIKTGEVFWSDEVYRIFGLNPQELRITFDSVLNYVHPEDRDYLINEIDEGLNGSPFEVDCRIIQADGEERTVHTEAVIIFYEENAPIQMKGIVQDITESKRAEKELEKVNRIRIKEIHHRIKNNLQVITSLLDLQAEKFQNKECIKDSEVLEAFEESQNRVLSMSLIHEELYKGEGTNKLNFSAYVKRLAENLFQTYSVNSQNVRLYMDLEENSFFDMDTAIPLGIIVNELISNSLKHAFNENQEGEIRIRLCRAAQEDKNYEIHGSLFSLIISDNGKGIPEDIEFEKLESLGLQLVSALVDQLEGEFEIKRKHGTEFRINFKAAERS